MRMPVTLLPFSVIPTMRRISVFLVLSIVACKPSSTERQSTGTPNPPASQAPQVQQAQTPDTNPPANVSHGEAPIGSTSAATAARDPLLPAREPGRMHRVRFEMRHVNITVASGITYAAWTFNGQVPGPILHFVQGDTVDFTVINRADIPHSIDFHAAEIAPSKYYVNVMPGDSLHYRFVAHVPGAFMYHCGTGPVAMHIANGMYGALIVDPARALPPAKEIVLVQSEFYFGGHPGADSAQTLDWNKLLSLAPDKVVFNGRAAQYAEHPIEVTPMQLVRLYVVNAGPNRISSFHVVGGIFERVLEDGSRANPLMGVQTVNVPVGGGSIFEIRLHEPGDYPFVSHAFADATKGAMGVLRAVPTGAAP
ncbi:MAG: multicopper oxidase domain-containing protein [Gemmatimonadota bacterium]